MSKILNKITAIITTIILVGLNFNALAVYATSNLNQNTDTSESNVQFNATIGNSYNAKADINEELKLNLTVKVSNTGYLKDAKITLEGSNYKIAQTVNPNVKSINGNIIELNEINAGEILSVEIPIKSNKTEMASLDEFNKDSTVILNGTYVNEKGKEKKIEKKFTEHLEWTANASERITQKLVRYIKYENNKTMVSFKINEGIENNLIPVTSKIITINVPQISNVNPSNVVVTSDSNVEYKYENGILTINRKNELNENNKILWNSQDEYIVTYFFDVSSEQKTISSSITANITTIKQDTIESKTTVNEYETSSQVGTIIETIDSGTQELSKGYLYTNLSNEKNKLETTFKSIYKINIANKDLSDKIIITQGDSKFDTLDANNSITNNKVSINKDEFLKMLGDNGIIKIKNLDGQELGSINKDSLELNVNTNKIIIEITKPISEGNLNIIVSKSINGNIPYSKAEINDFKQLYMQATIIGYKNENENSKETLTNTVNLTEPKSNANIELDVNTLSTVVENKDFVLNAILKTKDISDALYTNPTIKITMPNEVTKIALTDAKLVYEDELQIKDYSINGNEIIFSLLGMQTKYADQTVSEGTILRMVMNLTLDNLAPTTTENIKMDIKNNSNSETVELNKAISVVAQTGFVTVCTAKIDGKTETSQANEGDSIKIDSKTSAKELTVEGTIINNLENAAEGFTVLGRIPFKGNKTLQGIELNSTIDTTISSPIEVQGIEKMKIYYSDSGEESIEGTSWNENFTSNSKSYKIVSSSSVNTKSKITFSYKVAVPGDLDYGNQAKAIYGVYYNNNSAEGTKQNLVEAKAVGITTGNIPQITSLVTAIDTNEGFAIENEGNVTEGEYITYKVKVSNKGKEDASKVKVTVNIPEGLAVVKLNEQSLGDAPTYGIDKTTKEMSKDIETLKAESEQTVEFTLAVTQIIANIEIGKDFRTWTKEDTENAKRLTANFSVNHDKLQESQKSEFIVKNTEGYLHTNLTSNVTNNVKENQDIAYRISIKNVNNTDKNNVTVKLQLPKEIEYTGTKYQSSYDKNSNVVTCNIEKISKNSKYSLIMNAKVTKNSEEQIKTTANITCNETTNKMKSNTLLFGFKNINVTATQSTNIDDNKLLDTDDLEFYIDIKNDGTTDQEIVLSDTIPQELKVQSYSITTDGKEIQSGKTEFINSSFTLMAGKTARVIVKTSVNKVEKDKVISIKNSPTITLSDNENIEVNALELSVTGTGTIKNDGTTQGSEGQTQEGTYKISGLAWFDENANGKKETQEQKIKGIKISLFEKDKDSPSKDANGKDLTTQTNDDGKYTFINVKPGNYIVIAEFDNEKYDITTYKLDDLSASENNDFISTKLNDKVIGATDILNVTNSNTYNIDLGLTTKKKFDLSLSKVVSRITVTNTKTKTKIYDYDDKNIAKVELSNNYVEYATVLVEYTIKVSNDGQVAGYAKSIVDYIPEGMEFSSELNNSWYKDKEGNGYNTSLANTLLQPGETKEIKLVLSRKMTGENTGAIRNTAEILTSYNELGLSDIDSNAGNKKDGEDDTSSADVIIAMGTGKEIASITGIALGILAIIAIAVYEIKKHIINKLYTI